ncbi:transposase [Bifidobacterium longum]|uniref:transposase n=1 Tax=Bifidobacterium longum TaxID=216816 RepID=UPI002570D4A6|nr:transposase [Bifidobacterium longum]MDL5534492.1 transposase [Bifidobacterium longum]
MKIVFEPVPCTKKVSRRSVHSWTDDERRRKVAEIVAAGTRPRDVQRLHGVSVTAFYSWKERLFPNGLAISDLPDGTDIPVVVRKFEADAVRLRCQAIYIERRIRSTDHQIGLLVRPGKRPSLLNRLFPRS